MYDIIKKRNLVSVGRAITIIEECADGKSRRLPVTVCYPIGDDEFETEELNPLTFGEETGFFSSDVPSWVYDFMSGLLSNMDEDGSDRVINVFASHIEFFTDFLDTELWAQAFLDFLFDEAMEGFECLLADNKSKQFIKPKQIFIENCLQFASAISPEDVMQRFNLCDLPEFPYFSYLTLDCYFNELFAKYDKTEINRQNSNDVTGMSEALHYIAFLLSFIDIVETIKLGNNVLTYDVDEAIMSTTSNSPQASRILAIRFIKSVKLVTCGMARSMMSEDEIRMFNMINRVKIT